MGEFADPVSELKDKVLLNVMSDTQSLLEESYKAPSLTVALLGSIEFKISAKLLLLFEKLN
jgi:hypothetical protein